MPITTHVTSLELSRRLKELKVPQNSHFVWFNNSGITGDAFWTLGYKEEIIDNGVTLYPEKTISAYLVSELGELLPKQLQIGNEITVLQSLSAGNWVVYYGSTNGTAEIVNDEQVSTFADTECNCRAKMLIHLLENHLISVEKLRK